MSIEVLEQKIIQWSTDRGIIQHSTPSAQALKAFAEMGEFADHVLHADKEKIKDDIGDVIVCLINVAHMMGTDLDECLSVAYNDIKDRKGRMVPGGAFVKDSDNG